MRNEENTRRILSASEALYGFCGWLTSRNKEIVASAHHDAAPWAELVDRFCHENGLPDPTEGWDKILKHPKE